MYEEFKNLVETFDKRNIFGHSSNELNDLPEKVKDFYRNTDPVDVEIVLNDLTTIKFYPHANLETLRKEYGFSDNHFIFATHEGDPILLKDGKVYTALHGAGTWQLEKTHASFEDFLTDLIKKIPK